MLLPPRLQRAARAGALHVAKQEASLWPLIQRQCCNAARSRCRSRSPSSPGRNSLSGCSGKMAEREGLHVTEARCGSNRVATTGYEVSKGCVEERKRIYERA